MAYANSTYEAHMASDVDRIVKKSLEKYISDKPEELRAIREVLIALPSESEDPLEYWLEINRLHGMFRSFITGSVTMGFGDIVNRALVAEEMLQEKLRTRRVALTTSEIASLHLAHDTLVLMVKNPLSART